MCVLCYRAPAVDAYGFERPDDFDYKTYNEFMSRYVHTLARRSGRWAALFDGSDQLLVSRKCSPLYFYFF